MLGDLRYALHATRCTMIDLDGSVKVSLGPQLHSALEASNQRMVIYERMASHRHSLYTREPDNVRELAAVCHSPLSANNINNRRDRFDFLPSATRTAHSSDAMPIREVRNGQLFKDVRYFINDSIGREQRDNVSEEPIDTRHLR